MDKVWQKWDFFRIKCGRIVDEVWIIRERKLLANKELKIGLDEKKRNEKKRKSTSKFFGSCE